MQILKINSEIGKYCQFNEEKYQQLFAENNKLKSELEKLKAEKIRLWRESKVLTIDICKK